jgi:epoxide hydrolase 4
MTATTATSGAALGGGRDGFAAGDGGVRLHYVERGRGPLVVLLHGFPEFWYAWRLQLSALADAGFRAVALDLRGYNLSDRPPRVEDYALPRLVADVARVIEGLGAPAHAVVGHDWGGLIAWRLAAARPDLLARLVVMNAPHPRRYREVLARHPRQMVASWYVGALQVPAIPEILLRRGRAERLIAVLRAEHARPGALSAADEEAYRLAFDDPDAVRAAIAYYRAAARSARPATGAPRVVPHPALVVWGMRDGALVPENVERLERFAPSLRVVRVPWARHFVQWDAPDEVNAALLEFLGA